MPNPSNIQSPTLVVGAGRTASSYLLSRLRFGQGEFYSLIENRLYLDIYDRIVNAKYNWFRVADDDEIERRALESVRQVLLTMFPSNEPRWIMKCIWSGQNLELLERLFPQASYIHLTRDPRTNISSMMERLDWKLPYSQRQYVEANENGLEFERLEGRYLRVRQEEFVTARENTWRRICEFLRVEYQPGIWEQELNTSPSTKGKVDELRADDRLEWSGLPNDVQAMATRLGYEP